MKESKIIQFRDWGEVIAIEQDNGEFQYWKMIQVGGRDDEGEFELVIEGPAGGEKAYF